MIKFMLITNDPELAHYAENCGVGRIFVDLEQLGKQARQGHLDTLISRHSMEDVAKVKASLSQAELLVRLNPLNLDTREEVNEAIESGADILMLPMFRDAGELEFFSEIVDGRVGVMPLVETYEAAQAIHEIVQIPGVTEVYIGLNDLHLDMQLTFMFELLANGIVDELVKVITSAGLPFGFGGIARYGEGVIPGEMILGEHLRLRSSSVILSRTFHRNSESISGSKDNLDLKLELEKLFTAGEKLKLRSSFQEETDYQSLRTVVANYVASKN